MMQILLFLIPLATLWLSVAIDGAFGEPGNRYHPVRWIGNFIDFFQGYFRRAGNGIISGILFAVWTVGVVVAFSWAIQRLASVEIILYITTSAILLKFTFALRSMIDHITPVLEDLLHGNLDSAGKRLSYVVRRDTKNLDEGHMVSACIETVAEGLVDGFSSPVLAFGLFGVPGAYVTRVVNTLDSMIGYKDEMNIMFGKATAWLDTAINFIPARATAFIILWVASFIGLEKHQKGRLHEESRKTESLNGGWPMGAMALALGVRLEKIGHYKLNESCRLPDTHDLKMAMRVFRYSAMIILAIASMETLLAAAFF